jgi:thiol:disulfide interchange protein
MSLIWRALSVGLVLALAACATPASQAVVKPELVTTPVSSQAFSTPEIAALAVVPEATAVPVADEAPQDPALLAVASGQPVFVEFYTDW